MIKRPEYSVAGMLKILKEEYLMSQRDVAKYLGVTQVMVMNWGLERAFPHRKNYEAVQDMLLKLSGRKVKYKGQAMDILNGEE